MPINAHAGLPKGATSALIPASQRPWIRMSQATNTWLGSSTGNVGTKCAGELGRCRSLLTCQAAGCAFGVRKARSVRPAQPIAPHCEADSLKTNKGKSRCQRHQSVSGQRLLISFGGYLVIRTVEFVRKLLTQRSLVSLQKNVVSVQMRMRRQEDIRIPHSAHCPR